MEDFDEHLSDLFWDDGVGVNEILLFVRMGKVQARDQKNKAQLPPKKTPS